MLMEFKLPELGENIVSGTAVRIAVSVGQTVKKDQALLELETDKATIEVPSSVNGVIKEILIKEGAVVKVGQVVMKIDSGATASAKTQTSPPAPETKAAKTHSVSESAAPLTQPTVARTHHPVAPAAATPPPAVEKDIAAAPSVRRFAREIGVNISEVPGSGPGGRISKDDIKAYAKQLLSGAPRASGGVTAQPLPDFSKWGLVERKPMNNIRRKTADHLSHAWQTIPHVTQFDKADIANLEKLRKQFSRPDRKLTVTPFIMKVMASALKLFPQFNASVDVTTSEIIYKKYCNIGVAVDTENGLLVPVVRDVEKKSILQLADELNTIAQRARDRKLTLDEMRGGSITITNLGGIGGISFTPIVNWPEVAILGISRAKTELNFDRATQGIPTLMLPLSLSYDHRLIDGADGARFLKWITDAIEQPFLMELEGK